MLAHTGMSVYRLNALRGMAARCVSVLVISLALGSDALAADYLLIQSPKGLVLYNRYQQRMSEQERSSIHPFSPIRIVAESATLGDGLTPCLKGELDGQTVYIEKEEGGEFVVRQPLGLVERVHNAQVIGDTVEVLAAGNMRIASPTQRASSLLRKGDVLVRLFRAGDKTYARDIADRARLGWVQFRSAAEGREWKVVKEIASSFREQTRRVLPAIRVVVRETNAKLEQVFDELAKEAGRKLPAPQWVLQEQDESVTCELETHLAPRQFAQTTVALSKRIETVVLGSQLRVWTEPGRIEIR